jgi:type I restriction enzyme R subunit
MKSLFETTRYFNDYDEIKRTENRVPHLEQEGGTYFVTFRLADSLPNKVVRNLVEKRQKWLNGAGAQDDLAKKDVAARRLAMKIEVWLDSGVGSCRLRVLKIRALVAESFRKGADERYQLHSFVIMPNHVHLLLRPYAGESLANLVGGWKKFTARQINHFEGRTGQVWAKSYFDRLIRDPEHLARVIRYIRKNPQKAGLGENEATVWESEQVKALGLR